MDFWIAIVGVDLGVGGRLLSIGGHRSKHDKISTREMTRLRKED